MSTLGPIGVWLLVMLALIGVAPAAAAESDEVFYLDLQRLGASRTKLVDHPWAKIWRAPAGARLRRALTESGSSVTELLLADAQRLYLRADAVHDFEDVPQLEWNLAAQTPVDGPAWTFITEHGEHDQPASWLLNGWRWSRTLQEVYAASDGNQPRLPFFTPVTAIDLTLEVHPQHWLAQASDEAASADFFAAIGLRAVALQLELTATGSSDRLRFPGFHPALAPVEARVVGSMPADALAVTAFGIDGAALAKAWPQWCAASPEIRAFAAHYASRSAVAFGPLETLLADLDGTVAVAGLASVGVPGFVVSLPATPGWDLRIQQLAVVWHFDAAGAENDAVLVTLPPPTPYTLHVRRNGGRWLFSTDLSVLLAMTDAALPASPARKATALPAGTVLWSRLQPRALGAYAAAYGLVLAMNKKDPKQARWLPFYRDVASALQLLSAESAECVATLTPEGLTASGPSALLAAVPPTALALSGVMVADAAVVAARVAEARAILTKIAAARSIGKPEPAPATPAQMQVLLDQLHPGARVKPPTAIYLHPDKSACIDQPIALVNPQFFGSKTLLLLRRDGAIEQLHGPHAIEVWKRAVGLVVSATGLTHEKWAPIDNELLMARYSDAQPLVSQEKNYLVMTLPPPWRLVSPARTPEKLALLFNHPDGAFVGMSAQAGERDDGNALTSLHDTAREMMQAKFTEALIVDLPDLTVAARPAKRLQASTMVNGTPWVFDSVVMTHYGWNYHFIGGAPTTHRSRDQPSADIDLLLERFAPADSQLRSANADALLPALPASYASEAAPFRIELEADQWYPYRNPAALLAGGAVSLQHQQGAWAVVVPADLGGRDSPLSAIARGMLFLADIKHDDPALMVRREITVAGCPGLDWRFSRTVNQRAFLYRLRVVRDRDRAYLIEAWQLASDPDTTAIDALVDGFTPLPKVAWKWPTPAAIQGEVWNQIGLHLFEANAYLPALTWFTAAVDADPAVRFRHLNALNCLIKLDQPQEGLAWLDERAKHFPDDLEFATYRAYFLAHAGQVDAAVTTYRALFGAGFTEASDFRDFVELLWDHDRRDEAMAACIQFPACGGTAAGQRLLAGLHRRNGDHARALAVLYAQLAKVYDADTALDHAQTHYAAEAYTEALAEATTLYERSSSTAAAYLKARCEYRLKWYRQGIATLEKALEYAPNAQDCRDLLKQLNAEMGQGGSGRLDTPVAAVVIPDLAEPDWSAVANAPAGGSYLLRMHALAFSKTDGLRHTRRLTIAIPDATAARAYSTLEFPFHALSEVLFVNRLCVRGPDGTVLSTTDPASFYVVDDRSQGEAVSTKIATLPITGVHPGCVIDCEITVLERGAGERFPFTTLGLAGGRPTVRSIAYAITDGPAPAVVASGSVAAERIGQPAPNVIRVELADLPALAWEPWQAPTATWAPCVWLGTAGRTWDAVGREYLATLAPLLEPEPAVTQTAQTIITSSTDPDTRRAAIAAYVQHTIAYTAIEFGRRATRPNAAARTLTNRYGDCKDQALLLQRLLSAAGISAHLALVRTDGPLHDVVPDLDQFNHLVVAVPAVDGLRWLDPTVKQFSPQLRVPPSLAGCGALVLDPAGPYALTIPDYPAGTGEWTCARQVEIGEDGVLTVREQLIFPDYFAGYLRGELRGVPVKEHVDRMQRILGSAVGEVQQVDAQQLDDTDKPLLLKLTYRVATALQRVDGRLIGRLPEPWAPWYLDAAHVTARRTPFALAYPLGFRFVTTWQAPAGWHCRPRAAVATDDDAFLGYDEQISAAKFSAQVAQHFGTHALARYADFCARSAAVQQRLALEVVVERVGAPQK